MAAQRAAPRADGIVVASVKTRSVHGEFVMALDYYRCRGKINLFLSSKAHNEDRICSQRYHITAIAASVNTYHRSSLRSYNTCSDAHTWFVPDMEVHRGLTPGQAQHFSCRRGDRSHAHMFLLLILGPQYEAHT